MIEIKPVYSDDLYLKKLVTDSDIYLNTLAHIDRKRSEADMLEALLKASCKAESSQRKELAVYILFLAKKLIE